MGLNKDQEWQVDEAEGVLPMPPPTGKVPEAQAWDPEGGEQELYALNGEARELYAPPTVMSVEHVVLNGKPVETVEVDLALAPPALTSRGAVEREMWQLQRDYAQLKEELRKANHRADSNEQRRVQDGAANSRTMDALEAVTKQYEALEKAHRALVLRYDEHVKGAEALAKTLTDTYPGLHVPLDVPGAMLKAEVMIRKNAAAIQEIKGLNDWLRAEFPNMAADKTPLDAVREMLTTTKSMIEVLVPHVWNHVLHPAMHSLMHVGLMPPSVGPLKDTATPPAHLADNHEH